MFSARPVLTSRSMILMHLFWGMHLIHKVTVHSRELEMKGDGIIGWLPRQLPIHQFHVLEGSKDDAMKWPRLAF